MKGNQSQTPSSTCLARDLHLGSGSTWVLLAGLKTTFHSCWVLRSGLPLVLVKHWNRILRNVVGAQYTETSKVSLDWAQSTWSSCRCFCSWQGGKTRWPLRVPSQLKQFCDSVIQMYLSYDGHLILLMWWSMLDYTIEKLPLHTAHELLQEATQPLCSNQQVFHPAHNFPPDYTTDWVYFLPWVGGFLVLQMWGDLFWLIE